jgi:hypothetical protein
VDGAVIREGLAARKFDFDVERALFALVANRTATILKPGCHERWLAEDIRIESAHALQLQHFLRAMDFVEANKEAIEKASYCRMADLLNLDVAIVFYDTTSMLLRDRGLDHGISPNDEVHGGTLAGKKPYWALRKCGLDGLAGHGAIPGDAQALEIPEPLQDHSRHPHGLKLAWAPRT